MERIHKGIDGNNWIITEWQKTKTPVKIPLLDKAQGLIQKYADHSITQVTNRFQWYKLFRDIQTDKIG